MKKQAGSSKVVKEWMIDMQHACSAGGLIMARGLGNQNMKKYHMWNLSHQDISNKVVIAPLLHCIVCL